MPLPVSSRPPESGPAWRWSPPGYWAACYGRPHRTAFPTCFAISRSSSAPGVEAAQDNSRQLARLMFLESRVLAALRDTAARFVSLETALRPITKLLQEQPRPARLELATQPTGAGADTQR